MKSLDFDPTLTTISLYITDKKTYERSLTELEKEKNESSCSEPVRKLFTLLKLACLGKKNDWLNEKTNRLLKNIFNNLSETPPCKKRRFDCSEDALKKYYLEFHQILSQPETSSPQEKKIIANIFLKDLREYYRKNPKTPLHFDLSTRAKKIFDYFKATNNKEALQEAGKIFARVATGYPKDGS